MTNSLDLAFHADAISERVAEVTAVPVQVTNQAEEISAVAILDMLDEVESEIHTAFDPAIKKAKESLDTMRAVSAKFLKPIADARIQWRNAVAQYHEHRLAEVRTEQAMSIATAAQEAEYLEATGQADEAIAVMASVPAVSHPKSSVSGLRADWYAEITDVAALKMGVCSGATPLEALAPNMTFLNAMAKRAKGTMKIPGVVAKSKNRVVRRPGRNKK